MHNRDINAAVNIKNTGQNDLYNQVIPDAMTGMGGGYAIPKALKKMASKIERSGVRHQFAMGPGKPDDL